MAISRFTVRIDREEAVAQAFRDRPHAVDQAPGFLRMEVLRGADDPREFWLLTYWSDRESYERWHDHHLHASHGAIPSGLKLVPGSAKVVFLRKVCD